MAIIITWEKMLKHLKVCFTYHELTPLFSNKQLLKQLGILFHTSQNKWLYLSFMRKRDIQL